jgi:hypothetical protein
MSAARSSGADGAPAITTAVRQSSAGWIEGGMIVTSFSSPSQANAFRETT